MNKNSFKFTNVGILTLTVTGLLASSAANAVLVRGAVTMNFNNPVLSATTLYPGGYYGNNTLALTDWFPSTYHGLINLPTNGTPVAANSTTQNITFPLNGAGSPLPTSVITYNNGGPPYDRTTQPTTMSYPGPTNSTEQFSFDGALKLEGLNASGTLTYLSMTDFNVRRINGVWNILSNDSGFGRNTDFQLINVVDKLSTTGELDGDIVWGNGDNSLGFTGGYGPWISADGNVPGEWVNTGVGTVGAGQTVLGHFRLAPVPAAPSNINASVATGNKINLTWIDNADNETSQSLERCQNVGCTNFVQIASRPANSTSFSNTGLTAGATYSYRIKAVNSYGSSTYYSNTVTIKNAVPAAPSLLTHSAKTNVMVALTWVDNANNEANFKIQRCSGSATCTPNVNVTTTIPANSTTYSNGGLIANTIYRYRVAATNALGSSAWSNIFTVTTNP